MLADERKQRILEVLRRDGRAVAVELSATFAVSEDTIRRDLRELAVAGELKRVHGGALPITRAATLPLATRRQEGLDEKGVLARAAARLIAPGQVIILDGGSTNLLLAQALPLALTGTVVTNSPEVAMALSGHEALEVMLLGGKLVRHAGTVSGPDAVDALRSLRADLCVLGVCSLHPEAGLTCSELDEAPVKRAMVRAAGELMVLTTADKLDAVATHRVASVADLGRLITTDLAREVRTRVYARLGAEVLRVAMPHQARGRGDQ
jgi:DeoR/GlpR family transcriptional regulator of sugar metabolism